jgi:hypothetical protein
MELKMNRSFLLAILGLLFFQGLQAQDTTVPQQVDAARMIVNKVDSALWFYSPTTGFKKVRQGSDSSKYIRNIVKESDSVRLNFIKANNYFDDGGTATYYNTERSGNTVYGIIDSITGQLATYNKVTLKPDGSPYMDVDIDGVIIRKKGSEYFKRTYSSFISADWFGAKHDGSTNDLLALTNAITSSSYLFLPKGEYVIDGELPLHSDMIIEGEAGTVIKQTAADKNIFITAPNVSISGIKFIGDTTAGHATDFQKNNGIFVSGDHVSIDRCKFSNFQSAGIQVENANYISITNNTLYGNKYVFGSSSDIVFYSTTTTKGAIITGNYCLSNNSQGIWFNALGHNSEGVISNNICYTMADDGITNIDSPLLLRRHGIETSYGSGSKSHLVVNGNICGNTMLSGIYAQSGTAPSGQVILSNNILYKNGIDNTGNGQLGAAIYINLIGGYALCEGNLITDYQGVIGAITMNGANIGTVQCEADIKNNTILNSKGYGVRINGESKYINIAHNTIKYTAKHDISYVGNPTVNAGGLKIHDNTLIRSNSNYPPVFLDAIGHKIKGEVSNNTIIGVDDSTNNQDNNVAILANQFLWTVKNNSIKHFYFGVLFVNPKNADGKQNDISVDNNEFDSVHSAIVIRKTSYNPVYVCQDNIFKNVTYPVSGGGYASAAYIGEKYGNLVRFYNDTIITAGTWEQGDVIWNTTPSTNAGWMCVASPSTWKSWDLAKPTPNLQQVTDAGHETTNDIVMAGAVTLYRNGTAATSGLIGSMDNILGGTSNAMAVVGANSVVLATAGRIRQYINADGTVDFDSTVSGENAIALNQFVPLGQLNDSIGAAISRIHIPDSTGEVDPLSVHTTGGTMTGSLNLSSSNVSITDGLLRHIKGSSATGQIGSSDDIFGVTGNYEGINAENGLHLGIGGNIKQTITASGITVTTPITGERATASNQLVRKDQLDSLAAISGGGASYTFSKSILNTSGDVTLVNDEASPGNWKYYGTDAEGAKGFYSFPERTSFTLTAASTYTVDSWVRVVFADYSSGTATITLPSASSNLDKEITVKNKTTNNVVITPVTGNDTNTLLSYGAITYKSDGTTWYAISKY